ncbi:cytochrome P450 [Xylaria grammica]|nr:cytochrome P450 [Xylaria grammica]
MNQHLGIVLPVIVVVLGLQRSIRQYMLQIARNILSWIINQYLNQRYPIFSCLDPSSGTIPTCPYRWPNGQGDVAKFLEGERNSVKWSKEYGRVYRLWSGMNPEIVLTQPGDVKMVFKDSDLHIKATNNDSGWFMGQLLGRCMGLVSGLEWRSIRASVEEQFAYKSASRFVPRIAQITQEYFFDLHKSGQLDRGYLTPSKDLRLLPFWIVAEYIYGTLTPHARVQLETLIPLRDSLFQTMIQGGVTRFSWSRHLPSRTNRDLKEFKQKVIVRMYQSIQEKEISLENVLQTMDEMLFGNLDVTVGALAWNPFFLAANPTFTTQLRREIAVAERESRSDYIARPNTLLACSILESARLRPIAAFSIPQASPETRVTAGYSVPGGTNFVVDTHALNITNPYWGSDSTQYQPSRFLNKSPFETRYHYWRFGFGPRQCLGKYLADFIIRVIVAHLVAVYELSLLPGSAWDKDPDTWIAQPAAMIRCERLTGEENRSCKENLR